MDYTSTITPDEPVLSTEEPDNSLSTGDEHLDTIPATESDEFIKSSIENLIPIPSESEEVMEIVIPEVGGIDDDILLTIDHDVIREKLRNVNLLISKIKALNANPTPPSDCKTKSSSTSLTSLLEETNTFDNSLPEFETFCFDVEEISSGSTTISPDISLPEYEAFHDDNVKEISSGSPTTHSNSPLYASFMFDLSINLFPPADKSDSYEFTDELIPFISAPDDNESFSDENIPKEIYSNPLIDEEIISIEIDLHHFNAESDLIESMLNQDSLIISSSSKFDSLLDEFIGELILLKPIPLGINEIDCDPEEEIRLIEKLLYDNSSPRPPKEFIFENSDAEIKSFSPSPIPVKDSDSLIEEIYLSLTPDDSMPPSIKDDNYDSEGDILEELPSNDSFSLFENESFHFDIPSSPRPPAKPPDDDSRILTVKVMGDISKHHVPMPRILPIHALNQEKSPHLLSHWGLKAFQLPSECLMMIYEGNIPILDV
nr:hypothetical protein [Tanacetum cinerariifolium]